MIRKNLQKDQRKLRIKASIGRGNAERPRIIIYRSNAEFYAQVVDDTQGKTLFSVDTRNIKATKEDTKTTLAEKLGKALAEKLEASKIKVAIFDRNGNRYHGRVKAFCESLRANKVQI